MTPARALAAALAVSVALVVQVSVLAPLSWQGIAPNVVLLVVVAVGLQRDAELAMVVGFGAGLLLDLAPPADHVAGRWALALMIVAYVAGRVGADAAPGPGAVAATVAASSFLGTSVFALTGLLLGELPWDVAGVLAVVALGVGGDLLLAPLVLPGVWWLSRRLEPERA